MNDEEGKLEQPVDIAPAVVLTADQLKFYEKKPGDDPRIAAIKAIPIAIQRIEAECSKLHHLGHRKKVETIRRNLAMLRVAMNTLWRLNEL